MLSISLCHDVQIAPAKQKAKAQIKREEFRESFHLREVVRVNSSLMMHPDLPEYQVIEFLSVLAKVVFLTCPQNLACFYLLQILSA